MIDRQCSLIRKTELDDYLARCAAPLNEQLRKAVFCNACDLVFADGVVEQEEKDFIQALRRIMGISGDDAQTIVQVMRWKNHG